MPQILVNYIRKGEPVVYEERGLGFPRIEIKKSDYVFVDMGKAGGVCVVDMDAQYKDPLLIAEENKIPSVMDKEDLEALFAEQDKKSKVYKIVINEDGTIREATKKDTQEKIVFWRGPLEVNFKELKFMNGQILREDVHREE
jgi:hypothetical protein